MEDYGREFHIALFQVGDIFYLEGGAFDESCAQRVRGCSCFRLRLIFNEEKGIIDQYNTAQDQQHGNWLRAYLVFPYLRITLFKSFAASLGDPTF